VNEDEILQILKPMFRRYALEKYDEGKSPSKVLSVIWTNNVLEHFGDWVIRAGYITAVENGGQHGAMHEGVREDE